MQELIDHIKAHGFKVYMPKGGFGTYLYFTDTSGARIGYAQHVNGHTTISTKHKPCRYLGTGQIIDCQGMPLPTKSQLLECLRNPPEKKLAYKNIEELNKCRFGRDVYLVP